MKTLLPYLNYSKKNNIDTKFKKNYYLYESEESKETYRDSEDNLYKSYMICNFFLKLNFTF
jgi:hypothetical protein